MRAHSQPQKTNQLPHSVSTNVPSGFTYMGPQYPRLEPGVYLARGVHVDGPVWLKKYRRWSLRVEYALATQEIAVSAFYNLGNDPSGWSVPRNGNYARDWAVVNGGRPFPRQEMSPEVFLDGKFLEVKVDDCGGSEDGGTKHEAQVYSVVKKVLSARLP